MLGCLSNLVAVGFLEEKTFPLAVVRTRGSSLSLLPTSPPLSPCPAASRLRERNTVSRLRALATFLQKVVSRALERRALL